jgi:hypothetical protein
LATSRGEPDKLGNLELQVIEEYRNQNSLKKEKISKFLVSRPSREALLERNILLDKASNLQELDTLPILPDAIFKIEEDGKTWRKTWFSVEVIFFYILFMNLFSSVISRNYWNNNNT